MPREALECEMHQLAEIIEMRRAGAYPVTT
jgi:hypothetical protein